MQSSKMATRIIRAALLGLFAWGVPAVAHADLVAPFLNRIDVDPAYVTGVNVATDIAFTADGRAVITTKSGQVFVRHADGTKNAVMNLFGTVDTASEKGLLGVVAHPTAANTFFFYVSNGTDTTDKHRVYQGVLNANNTLTINMATPIIAAARNNGPGLQGPANHDGGGLFVYQNHLYVSVGDTGHNLTPPNNKYGSCLNRPNGKILRVNLDGTVPTDNPLANETMVTGCDSFNGPWTSAAPDKRIYAWGFRNPFRFWIDPHTGLFWIGDVGEVTREEVSVGMGNQHYGWPFNEGTTPYGMLDGKNCTTGYAPARACTPPVHDYGHSAGANCVIGGLIPEGCGWSTALGGTLYYLFADHGAGWIHALQVRPDRTGVVSATATTFGTFSGGPASIRMGPDESLYVVFEGAGAVYRFTPRDRTGCVPTGAGGAGGMAGASGGGGVAGSIAGAGGVSTGGGVGGQSGTGGLSTTAGAGGLLGGAGASGAVGSAGTGVATAGAAGAPSGGVGASGGAATSGGGGGVGASGGAATSGGGGVGASGGAATSGTSSGGTGATGVGNNAGNDIDDGGSCGCRAAKKGGLGWVALALGLVSGLALRKRRRPSR